MIPTKRYPLTLLEILIVLMICSLLAGTLGISLPKALRKENSLSALAIFQSQLEKAKELALDFHADITVRLTLEERGLASQIIAHRNIPIQLIGQLRKKAFFPSIQSMQWNGKLATHLDLCFLSSELKFPDGCLTLIGQEKKEFVFKNTLYVLKDLPSYEKKNIIPTCPEEFLSFS